MKNNSEYFYITVIALSVLGLAAFIILRDESSSKNSNRLSGVPFGFNPNDYVKKSDVYKQTKVLPVGNQNISLGNVSSLNQIEAWEQYKGKW